MMSFARAAFATMFTAYSAVLPLVARDWGMTASQAGAVQSAYHAGFRVSLFAVGFLGDRFGAKRTDRWGSVLACASSARFAMLTALTYLAAVFGSALGGTFSVRHGRTTVAVAASIVSLACSLSFSWTLGLPMMLIVIVAMIYNVTGVADSSIHSTTLTELTPPHLLGGGRR